MCPVQFVVNSEMFAANRVQQILTSIWHGASAPLGRILGDHHHTIGEVQDRVDGALAPVARAVRTLQRLVLGERDQTLYDRMDRLLRSVDGELPHLFVDHNRPVVLHSRSSAPAIIAQGPVRLSANYWRGALGDFEMADVQLHYLGFHPAVRTWPELRRSPYTASVRRVIRHAERSRKILLDGPGSEVLGTRPAPIGVAASGAGLLQLLAEMEKPGTFSALVLVSAPLRITDIGISRLLKRAYNAASQNRSLDPGMRGATLGALDLFMPSDGRPPPGVPYLDMLPARPLMEIRKMQREIYRGLERLTPDIPVIFIHGEGDGFCRPSAVERVMKRMPSREKELIVIPRAGHLMAYGPERDAFLTQLRLALCNLLERFTPDT